MPSLQYPFLQLRLQDGSLEHRAYTRLPLLIRNPTSGQTLTTLGLVDTGADSTLFPAILANRLGHKLKGTGVKTTVTAGIEQTSLTVYKHTFEVNLLSPDMHNPVWTATMEIDCVESNPPLLLGVEDFLCHFKLTIDYPSETMRLAW
jgi:hypothetical protein